MWWSQGPEKKKYHRYPFPFVSVSEPPTFCHAPQMYVSAAGFFNGRFSARLVLSEPSPVDLRWVEAFSVSYRHRPRRDAPVRKSWESRSESARAVISAHICSWRRVKRLTVAAVIFIAGVWDAFTGSKQLHPPRPSFREGRGEQTVPSNVGIAERKNELR